MDEVDRSRDHRSRDLGIKVFCKKKRNMHALLFAAARLSAFLFASVRGLSSLFLSTISVFIPGLFTSLSPSVPVLLFGLSVPPSLSVMPMFKSSAPFPVFAMLVALLGLFAPPSPSPVFTPYLPPFFIGFFL